MELQTDTKLRPDSTIVKFCTTCKEIAQPLHDPCASFAKIFHYTQKYLDNNRNLKSFRYYVHDTSIYFDRGEVFTMKKSFNHRLHSHWTLGVIATIHVPTASPRCNETVSEQKSVPCFDMPLVAAWPEDGVPPIDRKIFQER